MKNAIEILQEALARVGLIRQVFEYQDFCVAERFLQYLRCPNIKKYCVPIIF
jgi:hypothetical protein